MQNMTAEHADMIIGNRCLDRDYPNLSDILGSDWICQYGLITRTPEEYMKLAQKHAYKIYPSMWKNS